MRRSVSLIRPGQLAQRALKVLALDLELLDVLHGLLVLAGGQRVHRAQLLAAAGQALDPALEVDALLGLQRLLGGLGLQAQAAGDLGQRALHVGGPVAGALRGHLGGR